MAARINCFVCNERFNPRVMRIMRNFNNINKTEIAKRFRQELGYPNVDIDENSRVCLNCDELLKKELEAIHDPDFFKLKVIKGKCSDVCFICGSQNNLERLGVEARVKIYVDTDIYIPESCRSCPIHLNVKGFLLKLLYTVLQFLSRSVKLNGLEVSRFFRILRNYVRQYEKSPIEPEFLTEEEYVILTSLTKEQFDELHTFCNPYFEENVLHTIEKKHLLLFLCKLR